MATNELKQLSTEELIKKEKQLKTIIGLFTGFLIVGMAAAIYLSITKKKMSAGVVACFGLLAVLMGSRSQLKKLRAEIKLRQ
jgi:hypothetical protein